MPRVIPSEYYRRHQFLVLLRDEPGADMLVGLLSFRDQQHLLNYYHSFGALDEPGFQAHRRRLEQEQPTLAARAGRAFRVVENAYIFFASQAGITPEIIRKSIGAAIPARGHPIVQPGHRPRRGVNVIPIAQPIDYESIARAVVWMAQHADDEAGPRAAA